MLVRGRMFFEVEDEGSAKNTLGYIQLGLSQKGIRKQVQLFLARAVPALSQLLLLRVFIESRL